MHNVFSSYNLPQVSAILSIHFVDINLKQLWETRCSKKTAVINKIFHTVSQITDLFCTLYTIVQWIQRRAADLLKSYVRCLEYSINNENSLQWIFINFEMCIPRKSTFLTVFCFVFTKVNQYLCTYYISL